MRVSTGVYWCRSGCILAMSLPSPVPSASPSCSRTRPSEATGLTSARDNATSPEESKRQRKFDEWKSTQQKRETRESHTFLSEGRRYVSFL